MSHGAPKVVVSLASIRESGEMGGGSIDGGAVVPEVQAPEPPPVLKVRFIKLHGVAQEIRFPDGSKFKFRMVRNNRDGGYEPTSYADVVDETLVKNLRWAAAQNCFGVVEVKA